MILVSHPELDHATIAEYLHRKAAERDVPVSRLAFHNPDVAARASQDYEALAATTRTTFIPLAEALACLSAFVAKLPFAEAAG